MRRVALSTVGLLLAMCGGAAKPAAEPVKSPEETAREAKERELDALFAEEPKTPYQLEKSRALHASRECGQGPFVVEVPALGTKHGEKLEVYACAPRNIAGRARVTSEWNHDGPQGEGHAFGSTPADNQRCRASEVEVAHMADAGATTPSPAPTAAKAGPSHTAGAATKPEGEQLVEDTGASIAKDQCPAGLRRVSVSSNEYHTRSGPALHGKLRVEIWSAEPNDLRGVSFVVQQLGVDPSLTDEAFDKLMKDHDAWYQRYRAFEQSHDDLFVHEDPHASFAPPPPPPPKAETQPPKPSVHAEWVPGYYHRGAEGWAWISGWWRVPDADVQAKLTVVAPAAPPPPREEASEQAQARPAPEAVWATGHWQWDGARWVWVTGGWRLPPQPNSQWRAPSWRPEARGFVFVPGGWSIRVR